MEPSKNSLGPTSFVTMLLLVIAKINYLTRNKACMTMVNAINIRKYP